MKSKFFPLLLVVLMMLTIFNVALAQGSGVMIQKQDRDQTNINIADQEQARLHLRERLQITDVAIAEQQERFREQNLAQFRFVDTEDHWAQAQLQSAYHWGLAYGYPDGRFNPDGNITGIEGVAMMTRLMNRLSGIDASATTPGEIAWDVVPDWAQAQFQERNALRIMSQTPFYAEPQLNRLQFAMMLAKALGIEEETMTDETVVFLDQDVIPAADLGYIHALRTMGVVVGNNGNFYPEQLVTRAEAVAMLTRILEVLQ